MRTAALTMMLTLAALPFAAAAQPASCSPERLAGVNAETARLRCDIDRATDITNQAERLHGPAPVTRVEIVDTQSPSGAAYLYMVFEQDNRTYLDARSVPMGPRNGIAPACSLRTALPDDVDNRISLALSTVASRDLPAYGPREEVTLNPDGSRNVRLIVDSHDIITRIAAPDGPRYYSRHAGSADEITGLNNLVIGVANLSSGWICSAS